MQIRQMEEAVGFDFRTRLINRFYSEDLTDALLDGLAPEHHDAVKLHSLRMLEELIRQFDVPRATIVQQIGPKVERLLESRRGSADKTDLSLVFWAEGVLWEISYREIRRQTDRIEFLRDHLEKKPDGNRHRYRAMDYLAELASEDARRVLQAKLTERLSRAGNSGDSRTIERLRASLEKIAIIRQLESLDSSGQASRLGEMISERKSEAAVANNIVLMWLIRRLGMIEAAPTIKIMSNIWRDESYDFTYRYEAQETLVRRRTIGPSERTLLFYH